MKQRECKISVKQDALLSCDENIIHIYEYSLISEDADIF